MKYIRIVADTNDADYIQTLLKISEKDLKFILPLIKAIKNNKYSPATPHNFPMMNHNYGEYEDYKTPCDECTEEYCGHTGQVYKMYRSDKISKEMIATFIDLCPSSENGIHTIYSVEVFEVTSIKKLM